MLSERRGERGFSRLTMVIVVSVLVILTAVVAPQVNSLVLESKIGRFDAEIKTLRDVCLALYSDVGHFPAPVAANIDPGIAANANIPAEYHSKWDGPYLDRWPSSHPWEGPYHYQYGSLSAFDFDGTPGNEVYITITGNLTMEILTKIDQDLDDGDRNRGTITHNNSTTLNYYIGEGSSW